MKGGEENMFSKFENCRIYGQSLKWSWKIAADAALTKLDNFLDVN